MTQLRDKQGRFTNPFEILRASKRDISASYDWYVQQIKHVGQTRLTPNNILGSDLGKLTTRPEIGSMYLFQYDPKLKEKLPVYDQFPLVLPFNKAPGGFVGINLHYLPTPLRAKLLGRLYQLANSPIYAPTMRLRLSWETLQQVAQTPALRFCVKRYLTRHMRSRFFKINPIDWRAVLLLPIEDFQKMRKEDVYRSIRSAL